MHITRRGLTITAALLAAMLPFAAGCAAPSVPTTPHDADATDPPASTSVMICADEAQREISEALGVVPSEPPQHSWSDRLYTCRYRYAAGTLVLAVKELADSTQAAAYYANRHSAAQNQKPLPALGEEAFADPNGSILVRQDTSVLLVDVSGLPDELGPRRLTREAVGIAVASVIMQCWIEQ